MDEIKRAIIALFAFFQLEEIKFLSCGQDNRLSVVNDLEMCGDALFEVAGQGNLYALGFVPNVCMFVGKVYTIILMMLF